MQLDLDQSMDDATSACFIYLIYANEPSVYDVYIAIIARLMEVTYTAALSQ